MILIFAIVLSYVCASVYLMDDVLSVLAEATAELVTRPVFGSSSDVLVASLVSIASTECQLAAVKAAVIRELEGRDFARGQGASSLAAWLRDRLRMSGKSARDMVALSRLLDTRPMIRAAVADGSCSAEHALVIDAALAQLPDDVDAAVADEAELVLLDQASEFDPDALRKLGRRVLDHVAPEIAEDALRRLLERTEARARQSRAFTVSTGRDGRCQLSGWLDIEAAAIVKAAIEPFSRPTCGDDGPDMRSSEQRRADALTEVCRLSLASGALPDVGGQRPQIAMTVEFDVLRRELGVATLDTGELLSAAVVRRLACDAQIIPAVLGGDGAVLDVGRARRLFTGALRRALVLRDGGCAFPSCDRPPGWADAHHIVSWVDGGLTSLDNGVLLCGLHHRFIHASDWQIRLGRDRHPEFIPPAHVDPDRRPRRNHHHRPGPTAGRAFHPRT